MNKIKIYIKENKPKNLIILFFILINFFAIHISYSEDFKVVGDKFSESNNTKIIRTTSANNPISLSYVQNNDKLYWTVKISNSDYFGAGDAWNNAKINLIFSDGVEIENLTIGSRFENVNYTKDQILNNNFHKGVDYTVRKPEYTPIDTNDDKKLRIHWFKVYSATGAYAGFGPFQYPTIKYPQNTSAKQLRQIIENSNSRTIYMETLQSFTGEISMSFTTNIPYKLYNGKNLERYLVSVVLSSWEEANNYAATVGYVLNTEKIKKVENNTKPENTDRNNNSGVVENPNVDNNAHNEEVKEEKIDVDKYIKYAKALYNTDVDISDKFEEGVYLDGYISKSFSEMFGELIKDNKVNLLNLIGGVQLGTNLKVTDNLKVGAFTEYKNNGIHNVAIGGNFKYNNDVHNLLGFSRYRVVLDNKHIINHNVDTYVNYGGDIKIKDTTITPKVGTYITYATESNIDEKVSIEDRLSVVFDISSRFSYSKLGNTIYLEPIFKFGINTDQNIVSKNNKEKVRIDNNTYEFLTKIGYIREIKGYKIFATTQMNTFSELKFDTGFSFNW